MLSKKLLQNLFVFSSSWIGCLSRDFCTKMRTARRTIELQSSQLCCWTTELVVRSDHSAATFNHSWPKIHSLGQVPASTKKYSSKPAQCESETWQKPAFSSASFFDHQLLTHPHTHTRWNQHTLTRLECHTLTRLECHTPSQNWNIHKHPQRMNATHLSMYIAEATTNQNTHK
jgi:hypothetical protein